jgi:hypothetical protein
MLSFKQFLYEFVQLNYYNPTNTIIGYKLFKFRNGNIYPLYVNANKPVPMNEWIIAEAGEILPNGKVKSKLGGLAYRPGWHSGIVPVATHIGGKSHGIPSIPPDYRKEDEIWAEVEIPADKDWQTIANSRARISKNGKPIESTAHITDTVPYDGYYMYKTNSNMTGKWIISGAIKVNKILTDDEVKAINDSYGVADLPRLKDL